MIKWQKVRLGEVCSSISETYHGKDEKVVLVNTSDVLEGKILNHELTKNEKLKGQFKKVFRKDDILYSEIRPANKRFAYVDISNTSNYIASTKLMVIRANKVKILPKFLYTILKSNEIIDELQHLAETRSGTFPQITFASEVAPMEFFLPPFETQGKIVSVLEALDDKIELNNRINNNLEQQAQALFKSWFVDFEPFGGKMPDDWSKCSLLENPYCKLLKPGIKNFTEKKYYVATADANERGIINKNTFITSENKPSRANMQPCLNSIWFAKMKNSRKQVLIDEVWKEEVDSFILSTGFFGFCCEPVALEYLWCFISSLEFDEIKNKLSNGTTMEAINNDGLSQIDFVVPSYEILQKFNQITSRTFNLISKNKFENEKLTQLRDTLLPKLMSGEIDVSKVDISDLTSTDKLSFNNNKE